MYELILTELCRLNNVDTDVEKAQYLQSLQSKVRSLRAAYQNSVVNITYGDERIQAAYMLAYFPQYSQIIREILTRMRETVDLAFAQRDLSVCFFGSGPSPEVYGLLQFLSANSPNIRKVTAYTFDINAEEWTYSRSITENCLVPSIWHGRQLELISNIFDLSEANSVSKYNDIIASSRLIVFQNCLNELRQDSHPIVTKNFGSLAQAMRSGSILMIIDLSNYSITLNLIRGIGRLLTNSNLTSVLLDSSEPYNATSIINTMPPSISQNLLTGIPYQVENGLIPRRWINYYCLAMRKI